MNIPNDVLSYMILSKLHANYPHHVEEIIMNESMIKNPKKVLLKLAEIAHIEGARKSENQAQESTSATALFKSSQKNNKAKTKPEHPCSPGKHNELANHPQRKCLNFRPHLRPNYKGPRVNLSTVTPDGPVFQGFERSSESRAFDGVAPEDDTVIDDRNNRERSRVRNEEMSEMRRVDSFDEIPSPLSSSASTNPVDEDVKNYSNGLMNGSNVIRSNGMNDMVTRTRVHSSLVVGHIGPYIPPETYGIIFEECKRLPGKVKHLIAPGPRHETCTVLQRSGGLKQQYELIPTQQDSPQSHQG
ncbi:hypothetical protein BY996DRAFT_6613575 [Phakopsora pachyrhizi]|nr:hypothetical protein BY996DRAFT_6613575 [Phakopsora pachyrhizi]